MDDAVQWEKVGDAYKTNVTHGAISVTNRATWPSHVWVATIVRGNGKVHTIAVESTLLLAQSNALLNAAGRT